MFDSFMSLYECEELIQQIESKAEQSDGVLSDEDMQAIVLAQTTSIDKLSKLCRLVKFLEGFSELAKSEIERLYARKKAAENRVESIKGFLLPYLQEHGPVTAGFHRLSTRVSKAVILDENFHNPQYGEVVTTFKPDKKMIKESIEHGVEVEGAHLETRLNVQIR